MDAKDCDVSIRIGGEAGQGMRVISSLLGKIFLRGGRHVFVNHDIMSRVRGGHNSSQIRVAGHPVGCPSAAIDLVIALDRTTFELERGRGESLLLFDPDQVGGEPPAGDRLLPVPMARIAKGLGDERMINSVASGAALALFDLPLDPLDALLEAAFRAKGDHVVEANRRAARAGYDLLRDRHRGRLCGRLGEGPGGEERREGRLFLMGSEAMALGLVAGNLRFYSAYPMSPSTPIMEYLASHQEPAGLVMVQAEDEIAAANMAIGASFAGARSAVGTSGGGLALMVEAISLAGMTETPVVFIDCQRPGPATGLPTRTEQADLLYVLTAGHGEFPRAILAPGTAEEAFRLAARALSLAEAWQTPVFLLGEQSLNDSSWTTEALVPDPALAEPRGILSPDEAARLEPGAYKRYALTESGVSPLLRPGTPGQVVYADSDEHTEEGHITESAEVREAMVRKRLRKLEGLRAEMARPDVVPGPGAAAYLVSWGATRPVVAEVVERLRAKGRDVGAVHFSELWPLPPDPIPAEILGRARLVAVEGNATGQLASLLRMEAGIEIRDRILRWDGRPWAWQELAARVEETLDGGEGRP